MVKTKYVFLSSDWDTASKHDTLTYIRLIESMNQKGIIISSRIGNYEETITYLKNRCKE